VCDVGDANLCRKHKLLFVIVTLFLVTDENDSSQSAFSVVVRSVYALPRNDGKFKSDKINQKTEYLISKWNFIKRSIFP
jgi:hypothetical protein